MTEPPNKLPPTGSSGLSFTYNKRVFEEKIFPLSQLPQWFIGFFAIVYFCGYGIDDFYCSYFAISHLGDDVIKLRYIHLGVEFLSLVSIFCIPLCFGVFGFNRTYLIFKNERNVVTNICTSFYGFLWPMSIYSFIVFTPQDYFSIQDDSTFRIRVYATCVVAGALFYMASVQWFSESKLGKFKLLSIAIPLICVFTTIFDYFVLSPLMPGPHTRWSFFGFFLCCVLFSATICRSYIHFKRYIITNPSPGFYLRLNSALIFGSFLFMSAFILIVSYTYGVLINIPSSKGGSDFTHAAAIKIHLKDDKIYGGHLENVVSIYETSSNLFLARILSGNDPCQWKYSLNKPDVIQINKSDIDYIETYLF